MAKNLWYIIELSFALAGFVRMSSPEVIEKVMTINMAAVADAVVAAVVVARQL